ncbi:MAG: nitrite reductase, copper-containing [Melioribacteraceae bacterium]|nr:nitrite reductase, copper-containing [Melioribacteraceae bacterium]MCF8262978.1 nitrite reductase, copper-containing [Melioribacteraceae bacterium]MCF8430589.1 nitrite reductase, copper-containing [Melioribacteraceae bacterium]
MKSLKKYLGLFIVAALFTSGLFIQSCSEVKSTELQKTIEANLTYAPYVPNKINRDRPAKVIVEMEVRELVGRLSDGVEYTFWTFGGQVPGQFIRVREGDEVEFRLHNHPTSKLPHNIDLHAVTGPGGGAVSSFTTPGHTSVFSFKALNAGLYVYHCATAPVGLHIANGMYGLILVEPEEGLPPVDREYYVMQSEFYTEGGYGEEGFQPFSMEKALDENPDYVVFNGSVGSLVGDNSITAKVGERVRLFVGNGGPNLVSSFHVIGEIFDAVYQEGGTSVKQNNVQTTLIPAGGSAIVEFKVDVPGEFILVDHSIFRAFNKGALGKLAVSGPEDKTIYSGKTEDKLYNGIEDQLGAIDRRSGKYNNTNRENYVSKYSSEAQNVDYSSLAEAANSSHKEESSSSVSDIVKMGKRVYQTTCFPCHQSDGEGIANVFPPIKNSDWIEKNGKAGMIRAVNEGLSGEIKVNGKSYNNIMPPQQLNEKEMTAVLTYVYKQFNNSDETVTAEDIAKYRAGKLMAKK